MNRTLPLFFFLFFLLLLFRCNSNSPSPEKKQLKIAVAANVQFAMKEIQIAFEKQHNISVILIVSSSGKLTAQIKNGAPFDLFLSANMKYPKALYGEGYGLEMPKIYAKGTLVLWTLKDLALSDGLKILNQEKIKQVALANPKHAPYGIAAIEALKSSKLFDPLKSKWIYGESISQVNQYVSMKSVDIGLTSKSTVLSPKLKGIGTWNEISLEHYSPIEQGILLLKRKQKTNEKAARQFYDFLFSPTSKTILKKYGYFVTNF